MTNGIDEPRTRAIQLHLAMGDRDRVRCTAAGAGFIIGPTHTPLRVVCDWHKAGWVEMDRPQGEPGMWLLLTDAGKEAINERRA